MKYFVFANLFALASGPVMAQSPLPMPADIPASLTAARDTAEKSLLSAMECASRYDPAGQHASVRTQEQYRAKHLAKMAEVAALDDRLRTAQGLASGIWGVSAPHEQNSPRAVAACNDDDMRALASQAKNDISAYEQALQPYVDILRQGLWIGNIQLCQGTIQSAVLDVHEYSNEPAVNVHMNDSAATAFAQLTRKSVGNMLAIRFNGKILSTPVIHEQIPGGQAQITGMDRRDATAIVETATAPCNATLPPR